MPLFRLFPIITIVFICFYGCSKKEEKEPPVIASKTELSFTADGGLDSIEITATTAWKITMPPNVSWFYASPDMGPAGTMRLYVRAYPNEINVPRSANLVVTSQGQEGYSTNITIKQTHDLKITSVAMNAAPGGASIKIYGRGFAPNPADNKVTINGKDAVVQTATHLQLQVVVPAMAGSGPVIVSSGTKADTADRDFDYQWTGEVQVIAGGVQGYADGPAASAQFNGPHGLTFDQQGNLYVADYNNYKVRIINTAGMVSTLPGRIPGAYTGTGPNTDYGLPTATAVKSNGDVYIVEINSNAISKFMPPSSVSLFAGGNASGFQDGNGTAASFYWPVDGVLDAAGNLFVADQENLCIRKITPAGQVSTFAGGTWGDQDGVGTAARFNRPMALAIDAQGNLFVADYFNNRIKKITPGAVVTTLAGTGTHGSNNGNALTEATFTHPRAITVAADGTVFVAEGINDNTIRIIRPTGKVETIASFKEAGTGLPFEFRGIFDLALDKNGVLYAADYYNNRIGKIAYK